MDNNSKDDQHWLSAPLIRAYAAIFLAVYAGSLIYHFFFGPGVMASGAAVGSNYSIFRAASVLILEGRPAAPFDSAVLFETMRAMLPGLPEYRSSTLWNYPPPLRLCDFLARLAALLAGLRGLVRGDLRAARSSHVAHRALA
jgi:hypothetical protein